MTKDTFKQFVNKDGYAKGGVPVEESSQNLDLDPRSKSSIRGRNYIAQGDTVDVKGTKLLEKKKTCKGYLVLTCGYRQLN